MFDKRVFAPSPPPFSPKIFLTSNEVLKAFHGYLHISPNIPSKCHPQSPPNHFNIMSLLFQSDQTYTSYLVSRVARNEHSK